MVLKVEQERVKTLIADTVSLLCKNGLHYTREFSIEGLLGITLDQDEVFLVNIKEIVKTASEKDASESDADSADDTSSHQSGSKSRKRKKVKVKSRESPGELDDESNDTSASYAQHSSVDNSGEPPAKRSIKEEQNADDSDEDLVFIKDEPGADMSSSSFGQASNFNLSGAQQNNSNILGDLSQQGQLYATPTSDSIGGPPGTSQVWDTSSAAFNTSMSSQQLASGASPGTPGQQSFLLPPKTPDYLRALETSAGPPEHRDYFRWKDGNFSCPFCDKTTTSSHRIKTHISKHTGVNYFGCGGCGQTFPTSTRLKSHIRAAHTRQDTL